MKDILNQDLTELLAFPTKEEWLKDESNVNKVVAYQTLIKSNRELVGDKMPLEERMEWAENWIYSCAKSGHRDGVMASLSNEYWSRKLGKVIDW